MHPSTCFTQFVCFNFCAKWIQHLLAFKFENCIMFPISSFVFCHLEFFTLTTTNSLLIIWHHERLVTSYNFKLSQIVLTNNYKHKFILNLLGYIQTLKWFFFFISCSNFKNEHLLLKNLQTSMHWVKHHSQIF